jgi:hypothetical protein
MMTSVILFRVLCSSPTFHSCLLLPSSGPLIALEMKVVNTSEMKAAVFTLG